MDNQYHVILNYTESGVNQYSSFKAESLDDAFIEIKKILTTDQPSEIVITTLYITQIPKP